MEEVRRIYILLLHGNGLKIKDIAKELDLDKYYVADILFSTDNIPFWYQDSSSLWFAKEGAIELDEPEDDRLTTPIVLPKVINTDRFIQGHTSAAFRSYISHLSKYRVYSENELAELFRRYREGDKKARELIVKSHQKLVTGIAVLYAKYGIPLEDLIQEGNIGLIRAIDRFDNLHFRSFQKFAKGWILQAISSSMTSLPYMVRLPISQLALYRKVRKFKEKYEQQNGYLPPVNDIEIDDDADIDKIAFLDKLPDRLKDITTLSEDLDIYESQCNATEEIIESDYNKRHAWQLLSRLNYRERHIIQAYFGINVKEETLSSIGERFNLTRERVRQILWKTVRRLQDYSGIKREEAKIGDTIRLESTEQVGKVISSKKLPNGATFLTIKTKKGHTTEISVYDSPYKIVPTKTKKKNHLPSQPSALLKEKELIQSDQKDRSSSEIQQEVTELDGVKVGNKIVYNGKNCTICKILVRGSVSRLLVKYDNEVLDYVPNDMSSYITVSSNIKPRNEVQQKSIHPQFQLSTSLDNLVIQNIITHRQLLQCHKKKLRTIGDVKQIIEKYKLTPDSTRFTKYTLEMWFSIIRLLEKVHNETDIYVHVGGPSAAPYTEIEREEDEPNLDEEKTHENSIDTKKLDTVFYKKSTSYKYFWFLAIISLAKEEESLKVAYKDILIRMAALAWPIVFDYEITLGKSDMLPKYLVDITKKTTLIKAAPSNIVEKYLYQHYNSQGIDKILDPLLKNVPYRFLSPWIPFTTNEEVKQKSNSLKYACPYALGDKGVLFNEDWWEYIMEHYSDIVNFTKDSFIAYVKQYNDGLKLLKLKTSGFNHMQ